MLVSLLLLLFMQPIIHCKTFHCKYTVIYWQQLRQQTTVFFTASYCILELQYITVNKSTVHCCKFTTWYWWYFFSKLLYIYSIWTVFESTVCVLYLMIITECYCNTNNNNTTNNNNNNKEMTAGQYSLCSSFSNIY